LAKLVSEKGDVPDHNYADPPHISFFTVSTERTPGFPTFFLSAILIQDFQHQGAGDGYEIAKNDFIMDDYVISRPS